MTEQYGVYHVGLKALFRRGNSVLLLRDATTGRIDLPGGRINQDEVHTSIGDALRREIREELGANITYTLQGPLFQFRRANREGSAMVFITVYGAEFIDGTIELSDEHSSYEWVDPTTVEFQESDFGNAEETQVMNAYLQSMNID